MKHNRYSKCKIKHLFLLKIKQLFMLLPRVCDNNKRNSILISSRRNSYSVFKTFLTNVRFALCEREGMCGSLPPPPRITMNRWIKWIFMTFSIIIMPLEATPDSLSNSLQYPHENPYKRREHYHENSTTQTDVSEEHITSIFTAENQPSKKPDNQCSKVWNMIEIP
jgi:hypothetical protein